MVLPYKVSRSTKRCAVDDRPLRPGEWYFSAIFLEGEDFVRKDYAVENFASPPEAAIGHWKRRMPPPGPRKKVPLPAEVLLQLLRELESFPDRHVTRYLLALTLLRRRVVTLDHSLDGDGSTPPPDASKVLRVVGEDGGPIEVAVCALSAEQAEQEAAKLEELMMTDEDEKDSDADETEGPNMSAEDEG